MNDDDDYLVYSRRPTRGESAATGWFVAIIVCLALLAIGYLVFSANNQPAPAAQTMQGN